MAEGAAEVMLRIQSVTCCQCHVAAAAATVVPQHGTAAVAVTTASSSKEMMEEEVEVARCPVLPVSTLSPTQRWFH